MSFFYQINYTSNPKDSQLAAGPPGAFLFRSSRTLEVSVSKIVNLWVIFAMNSYFVSPSTIFEPFLKNWNRNMGSILCDLGKDNIFGNVLENLYCIKIQIIIPIKINEAIKRIVIIDENFIKLTHIVNI